MVAVDAETKRPSTTVADFGITVTKNPTATQFSATLHIVVTPVGYDQTEYRSKGVEAAQHSVWHSILPITKIASAVGTAANILDRFTRFFH